MKQNIIKLNENKLKKIVAESIKKVLKETELNYDIDNFSGRWNRGNRFDIVVDGDVYYQDIPEESVDKLIQGLERKKAQGIINKIEIVDREGNKHSEDEEPNNIIHWYDEVEKTYDMIAMIKSIMNPVQHSFKATSIQDALKQAMEYYSGFSSYGEKDVDIFYIKHNGYDEF